MADAAAPADEDYDFDEFAAPLRAAFPEFDEEQLRALKEAIVVCFEQHQKSGSGGGSAPPKTGLALVFGGGKGKR